MQCDQCPLRGTSKTCPSTDWKGYCQHVERGSTYWIDKLLREAELPPKKSDPCQPDYPLVERPRAKGLKRELVISHYKEPIEWANDVPMHVALYQKCPGTCSTQFGDRVTLRHLPNKGREAGTYLDHIVTNYHDLAEWTYFVQGAPHSSDLLGRLAVAYMDTTSLTKHYKADWPGVNVTAHDLVEWHGGYEVRYGDGRYHGDRTPEQNVPWLESCWRTWFTSPQPSTLHYGYGAEWAVPRHRILARPLSFWTQAREAVNNASTDGSYWAGSPGSAWGFEVLWRYLFGDAKKYKTRKKVTVFQMAKNFAKAATVQLAAGNPLASQEEQDRREAICNGCPLYDLGNQKCSACGCTAMALKRSWLTSRCPEGKWEKSST